MRNADDHSISLKERARKREAIGLAPQRPTAKAVLYSPPDPKRRGLLWLPAVLVLAVIATGWMIWQASIVTDAPSAARAFSPAPDERLIVRDDFIEPHFPLPIRSNAEYALAFLGDLYQIQIERPGALAWAPLSQLDLGAYRLETDLRLASRQEFVWGFGGLIARFQNDENFYLFVIDNHGQYQIQLIRSGVWRAIQPWTPTTALTDNRQNLLAVVDDGATLRFLINASQVDAVTDPQLPTGDVGLIVGARSQGKAKGLFDWVALYETRLAE